MSSQEKSPEKKKNLQEGEPHHSKEELERIAEQRHFNERMKDNKERVKGDEEIENHIREEVSHLKEGKPSELKLENKPEKKPSLDTYARAKRITTNVVDFVPVVGSAKMILEGLRGKQYGTEKEIKGMGRVIHTVSGVVFLGLDMTGVGAIASELGKGVIKLGERAAIKKIEERVALEAIEKESIKLGARGETRIDKKEKIANS